MLCCPRLPHWQASPRTCRTSGSAVAGAAVLSYTPPCVQILHADFAHGGQVFRTRSGRMCVYTGASSSANTGVKKRVAVVGSGWAGLGAILALLKADASLECLLFDGSREVGGLAATSKRNRQPVEPGIKGFWKQYGNIDKVSAWDSTRHSWIGSWPVLCTGRYTRMRAHTHICTCAQNKLGSSMPGSDACVLMCAISSAVICMKMDELLTPFSAPPPPWCVTLSGAWQLVQDEVRLPMPFTDFTSSSFYSPRGLEVTSPVFSHLPTLPTPLGSFLYTAVSCTGLGDRGVGRLH